MNAYTNDNSIESTITVTVSEAEHYRVLWLSVIMQQLSDALSTSNKYPFNKRRKEALEWFEAKNGDGSDFAMVCELAGVSFTLTKKRIQLFLNREIEAVDFRCLHKGLSGDSIPMNRSSYLARMRKRDERRKQRNTRVISREFFRRIPKDLWHEANEAA